MLMLHAHVHNDRRLSGLNESNHPLEAHRHFRIILVRRRIVITAEEKPTTTTGPLQHLLHNVLLPWVVVRLPIRRQAVAVLGLQHPPTNIFLMSIRITLMSFLPFESTSKLLLAMGLFPCWMKVTICLILFRNTNSSYSYRYCTVHAPSLRWGEADRGRSPLLL